MTLAVALFQLPNAQVAQMLTEGFAYQGRAATLGAPRRAIGGGKELFIEDNSDRFHIWSLVCSMFDSTWHGKPGRTSLAGPLRLKWPV